MNFSINSFVCGSSKSFFILLVEIIHMHGGDIIKFAGDALMALWTAPISGSLGPQVVSAAHCALQMLVC